MQCQQRQQPTIEFEAVATAALVNQLALHAVQVDRHRIAQQADGAAVAQKADAGQAAQRRDRPAAPRALPAVWRRARRWRRGWRRAEWRTTEDSTPGQQAPSREPTAGE